MENSSTREKPIKAYYSYYVVTNSFNQIETHCFQCWNIINSKIVTMRLHFNSCLFPSLMCLHSAVDFKRLKKVGPKAILRSAPNF